MFPTEVPSIQDSRTHPSDRRMLSGPQVSPVAGEKLSPSIYEVCAASREQTPWKVI